MFLSLDGTFFVQLINFAIFFAVLNYVFLRPVGKAIAKRRAYIESLTADYDSAQKAANDLRHQTEQLRAEARRQAEQNLARKRSEASNKAAEIAADYHRRAQASVDRAQQTAAGELEAAQAGAEALVGQLADAMLAKAIPGGDRG